MAFKIKSFNIDDLDQDLEDLLQDPPTQEYLANQRKNAGEGHLIRMLIKVGLPIVREQIKNSLIADQEPSNP